MSFVSEIQENQVFDLSGDSKKLTQLEIQKYTNSKILVSVKSYKIEDGILFLKRHFYFTPDEFANLLEAGKNRN